MKRAIVTGFEPFGSYSYNPTQQLAINASGRVFDDVEVTGLVLPCSYRRAFEILHGHISRLSPDIIVSAGLASRVPKFRLEAFGRNIMYGKYADADGRMPDNEPIVAGGKEWYPSHADNVGLANYLFLSGLPAEVSVDAEGFVCNALLYLTSRHIAEGKLPIKNAFIHTPMTDAWRGEIEPGKIRIKESDLENVLEILLTSI